MSEANVNDSLFLLTQLKENASKRTSTLKVKLVPKCSQYLLPSAVQNIKLQRTDKCKGGI